MKEKTVVLPVRITEILAARMSNLIYDNENRNDFIKTAIQNEVNRRLEPPKALARKTDPATSKQAAESINVNRMERFVLSGISTSEEGSTIDEIMQELSFQTTDKIRYNSVSTRIAPLIRKGQVIDTGKTRPGSSGRPQRAVRRIL